MPYIYKIYNDINNYLYIGKTEDTIANRWAKHIWTCKNKPNNYQLYNAMNKYGLDKFHIIQIEECPSNILSDRERYWISFYDSYHNGYNLTPGGEGCPIYDRQSILLLWEQGYNQTQISEIIGCDRHTISKILQALKIPEEERKKFKAGNASKQVLLLDKNTNEMVYEFNSSAEALRFLGLEPKTHASLVSRACKNQKYTAYGYRWILKENYKKLKLGEIKNVKTS